MPILYTLVFNSHAKRIELLKSFTPISLSTDATQLGWVQVEELCCPNGQLITHIQYLSHPMDSKISQFLLSQAFLQINTPIYECFTIIPLPSIELAYFTSSNQPQEITQAQEATKSPPRSPSPTAPSVARTPTPELDVDALLATVTDEGLLSPSKSSPTSEKSTPNKNSFSGLFDKKYSLWGSQNTSFSEGTHSSIPSL